MPDRTLECQDCKQDFVFTEGEQQFFESKEFKDPRRCKPCRDKNKKRRDQGGGGGPR